MSLNMKPPIGKLAVIKQLRENSPSKLPLTKNHEL